MARAPQNNHPSNRENAGEIQASEAPSFSPAIRQRRKAPNAGGKSRWMRGFFERPGPPLWRGITGNFAQTHGKEGRPENV
jgi:hypothetical protein